jgi:hypothetical protein
MSSMSALFLTYLFCMVLGGVFVALSVFGGFFDSDADLDVDSDFDLDVDADVDVDMDAGLDHGYHQDIEVSVARRFNPFTSFKFYTFTLAFFGLTGVVFTMLGLWANTAGVFILSLMMGLFAGLGIAYTLFKINDNSASSGITARDYIGTAAKVMLPVRAGKTGKVRMHIKGQTIEMPARPADDEVVLDFNQDCFVLGIEDGVVQVVQPSALLSSSQPELEGQ